jgi:hypothetical protein
MGFNGESGKLVGIDDNSFYAGVFYSRFYRESRICWKKTPIFKLSVISVRRGRVLNPPMFFLHAIFLCLEVLKGKVEQLSGSTGKKIRS